MLDYQQWFNIDPIDTRGSKISRIAALAPLVAQGRLTVVDTGEGAEMLVEQMELSDREAVRSAHDDLVDALSGVLRMEALKWMVPDTHEEPRTVDFNAQTASVKGGRPVIDPFAGEGFAGGSGSDTIQYESETTVWR
jgi:hypothetical protein